MTDAPNAPTRFPWRAAAAAVCAWLGVVGVMELRNPRLVPSWHGFLHTAIVTRFPSPRLPPENPFYAGEPLPYYWAYHWLGAAVARLTGADALTALQILALVSLVALVVLAMDAGRRLAGSARAGALIGFLALAGVNPLGPAIAAGRALLRHDALAAAATSPVETVFVGDRLADDLMSRPLLGGLYFGTDWRAGQDLVWFWDISSRGPALAALMWVVWALLRGGRPLALIVSSLVLTALNPIVGMAVVPAIAGTLALDGFAGDRSQRRASLVAACVTGAALAGGAALALPTYVHLFRYGGAGAVSAPHWMLLKATYLTLGFGLLAALAVVASLRAPPQHRRALRALTGAGLALLALAVVAGLAEGNEHNLANAAAVLLAAPAAMAAWYGPRGGPARTASRTARLALVLALVHVPMTIGTLVAFDGRPPLPMRHGTRLERIPQDEPVARIEDWIRRETPPDAVLVCDPDRPIKMSGNASELPAFTARTLLVDQPNYLVKAYRGFEERIAVAKALVAGDEPSAAGREILRGLGRPVFVVAADPPRRAAVEARCGPALFAAGDVAVFRFLP